MIIAICCSTALISLALVFLNLTSPARPAAAEFGDLTDRATAQQRAARSDDRTDDRVAVHGKGVPSPTPSAVPSAASPAAAPSTSAAPAPTHKAPVAGLTVAQMDNAVAIIEMGKSLGVPERAHVIAMVTALQESNLRTLANPAVPASLALPNQGMGYDYDSVGIFQQRASMGWGPVSQLMSPAGSAITFYTRLMKVPGWQSMSVGAAAQAVQKSAFPYAYDRHEARAREIVAAAL
jgi:hypothetical protein